MKIFNKLLLITILILAITSCSNEDIFSKNKSEKISINLSNELVKLNYTSSIDQSGMLNVTLENISYNNQYQLKLDVTSIGYRLNISNELEQYSHSWLKEISPLESKLLAQSLLEFVDEHDNPISFKKEEMQGLFYLMSIFNAINRYHEISKFKSGNVSPLLQISTYEGYITGLTPYSAKEDIILNIPDFENWLDNYSGSRLLNHDIVYIKDKVNGLQNLSLKEYQNLVHEPLNNKNKSNSSVGC